MVSQGKFVFIAPFNNMAIQTALRVTANALRQDIKETHSGFLKA